MTKKQARLRHFELSQEMEQMLKNRPVNYAEYNRKKSEKAKCLKIWKGRDFHKKYSTAGIKVPGLAKNTSRKNQLRTSDSGKRPVLGGIGHR